MNISLTPESVFHFGLLNITNAVFSAIIIVVFLLIAVVILSRFRSVHNPTKLQLFLEWIIGGFYNLAKEIMGSEKATRYFSFIFTFFLFIVFANWWGLLPFVPSIGVIENDHVEATSQEHSNVNCLKDQNCILNFKNWTIEQHEHITHIFRAPSSDVSMTISLALLSVIFTNLIAVREKGILGWFHNYFRSWSIIDIFVGFLEIVSELGKIISFSFRLFGNIFAGEVLLLVITSLTFGIATLPFLALEVFIGFIQAFVFMMLTMVFISIATAHH